MDSRASYRVLWDGECGFCGRSVDWALARDAQGRLEATPYQVAAGVDPELARACARAVHLLHPDGRIERAGRACLSILELIGYGRLARWGRRRPFVWLVEAAYWLVARHRALFSHLFFRRRPPPSPP